MGLHTKLVEEKVSGRFFIGVQVMVAVATFSILPDSHFLEAGIMVVLPYTFALDSIFYISWCIIYIIPCCDVDLDIIGFLTS